MDSDPHPNYAEYTQKRLHRMHQTLRAGSNEQPPGYAVAAEEDGAARR